MSSDPVSDPDPNPEDRKHNPGKGAKSGSGLEPAKYFADDHTIFRRWPILSFLVSR